MAFGRWHLQEDNPDVHSTVIDEKTIMDFHKKQEGHIQFKEILHVVTILIITIIQIKTFLYMCYMVF